MMAVAGILFTDVMGLPKFWQAGTEVSPLSADLRSIRYHANMLPFSNVMSPVCNNV